MIPKTDSTNKNKSEQANPGKISLESPDLEDSALGVLIKIRLVWGLLLLIATAVLIVILRTVCYQLIPLLGAVLIIAGFACSIWICNRNRGVVVTQIFRELIWNWAGCLLGPGIILFGVYAKTFYPLFIPPVIATGMGLSCWIGAAFFEKRLQSCLAFSWWVGALLMWIVGTDYTLPFLGLLLLGFELVPDWLLLRVHEYRRFNIGNRH